VSVTQKFISNLIYRDLTEAADEYIRIIGEPSLQVESRTLDTLNGELILHGIHLLWKREQEIESDSESVPLQLQLAEIRKSKMELLDRLEELIANLPKETRNEENRFFILAGKYHGYQDDYDEAIYSFVRANAIELLPEWEFRLLINWICNHGYHIVRGVDLIREREDRSSKDSDFMAEMKLLLNYSLVKFYFNENDFEKVETIFDGITIPETESFSEWKAKFASLRSALDSIRQKRNKRTERLFEKFASSFEAGETITVCPSDANKG
jgi:hypothetical protein